ncbi:MAG: hypothetical protein L3J71_08900 [Victivallaceae bacterium]|nr:hypothetical protein [Victivallaceae bacterium]
MSSSDIKNIVADPRMISLIHNYCDSWCERCEFTSRCAVFAMGRDDDNDPEAMDINNKKFWDKMSKIFQDTFAMIQARSIELGIDINERDPELEARPEREEAHNNPTVELSQKYFEIVTEWFEDNKLLFEDKGKKLEAIHRMDVPGCNPEADAISLNDAVEVINFYQHFISAKVYRAYIGRRDDHLAEEYDFPKDSDGSAKIALIAIDRSIAAWVVLLKSLPDVEDSLLPLLVQLEKIRNELEAAFPDA